jgi:hypothetical protein
LAPEKVHFKSDGLFLASHLYKPKNFAASSKSLGVVTGGSMTSVKEQMAGNLCGKTSRGRFCLPLTLGNAWPFAHGELSG